jgi:hypothetical protein
MTDTFLLGRAKTLCKPDRFGKLSCFRTVRATINLASLISESLPLGFELIHRSHEQNFRESEAAERVLCDPEHNRRYRDSRT